jgi:dTMP kinase
VRGRLIALEGIDGCGKSTQARLLAQWIGEPNVALTSEPGATSLGMRLRQLLLDSASPGVSARAEALLIAADRADHVSEVIAPALADGRWVVSDRYSGSTLAYQGYGRGLDLDTLRQLVTFATGGLEADLNVLVEVARARLKRADADRFERLDESFHQRVRDGYTTIAASDPRWVVVDGTGTVDEVAKQVSAAISERLGPLPASAR